jgi:hypothetical protein
MSDRFAKLASLQAGKGDSARPVKGDKWRNNFDAIFRKPKPTPTQKPNDTPKAR